MTAQNLAMKQVTAVTVSVPQISVALITRCDKFCALYLRGLAKRQ